MPPARYGLLLMTALILLLTAPAQAANKAATAAHLKQRIQFGAAYAAAKLGGDTWKPLATGLQDYPLYPYLEAASIRHDIGTASRQRVEAYLHRYPGTVPAHDLLRDYLHQVAAREDWDTFLDLYQPGMGYALACDALIGRMAQGQKLDFDRDIASIWAKVPLPSACNPVLDWARKQGMITTARIWDRIEQASLAGRTGDINKLAQWLPKDDGIVAKRLVLAHNNPRKAVAEAPKWLDSTHTRMAVALALQRLAMADDEAAGKAWPALRKRFDFSAAQRHAIVADIALFNATDFEADSLAGLKNLPAAAQTGSTREWRVRVALHSGDWSQVMAALDALPDELKRESEWRYWRARALAQTGHKDQARKLFVGLARRATYYGFLAADWLGQAYAVCPLDLTLDSNASAALLKNPGLARAFELHALNMLPMARREWSYAMRDLDKDTQRRAAILASQQGWHDRAIFQFSSGNDIHRYRQRFPLAFRDKVVKTANKDGIDPAWSYAIMRAESAFVADAHSSADAYGLMQLLASTGKEAAAKLGIPWQGKASLFNADTNITLGTWYLAHMASRFGNSPWLASAAYNAGASKVESWLPSRHNLSPDMFIETIPYHETRAYVRRVLAFSVLYDWRMNGKVIPMSDRMPKPGGSYAPPGPDSPRKSVSCPALNESGTQQGNH